MSKYKFQHISVDDASECGFGGCPVTLIPHFLLEMRDGVRLALKIWFPIGVTDTDFQDVLHEVIYSPEQPPGSVPQPCVLEYLPYRKSDWTCPRDWRHAWMSSHGYVCVRADIRGTGDSEGLYYDEYTEQEMQDGEAIIAWLAEQKWCNGSVGVYGKSWGGLNGLQLAFRQPPALKALISLYSSDDRYATDIHYQGGCVVGNGMLSWASQMLLWNARPPCPALVADWKDVWRQRLENASQSWVATWLRHQMRDAYWDHGTIRTDMSRMTTPVLAMGGWQDGYMDPVLRLVRDTPHTTALIGPWGHDWPDVALPGPNIDFLWLCKTWWDRHLKGLSNEADDMPRLRMYLQEPIRDPIPPLLDRPGHWISVNSWPTTDSTLKYFVPSASGVLEQLNGDISNSLEKPSSCSVPLSLSHGLFCGEWLSFMPGDRAGPQQAEDANCLSWTSVPCSQPLPILGNPVVNCVISLPDSRGEGQLITRLTHVAADNQSTLISYGVLNLAHTDDHRQIRTLKQGQMYVVSVEMIATSYIVPAGERLRLCMAQSYFPMIWPPRDSGKLNIHLGPSSAEFQHNSTLGMLTELLIPVYEREHPCVDPGLGLPRPAPFIGEQILEEPRFRRWAEFDLSSGLRSVILEGSKGKMFIPDTCTTQAETNTTVCEITEGDVHSAHTSVVGEYKYACGAVCGEEVLGDAEKPPAVDVNITTHSKMWSNQDSFFLKNSLDVTLNGEMFFSQTWNDTIPRSGV